MNKYLTRICKTKHRRVPSNAVSELTSYPAEVFLYPKNTENFNFYTKSLLLREKQKKSKKNGFVKLTCNVKNVCKNIQGVLDKTKSNKSCKIEK